MCVCWIELSPGFDFTLPNHSLGFQDVVTIDMLREACPLLDVVDHNRRPKGIVSTIKDEASLSTVMDDLRHLISCYVYSFLDSTHQRLEANRWYVTSLFSQTIL